MEQEKSFEDLLKEYLQPENKGGDPVSTSPSSPVVLPGLSGNITANSMEEAQRILAEQNAQVRIALQTADSRIRELEAAKAKPVETTENLDMGRPQMGNSAPLEFLEQLVGNPSDVIGRQAMSNPELKAKLEMIDQFSTKIAQLEFGKAHPWYDHPQVFRMLDTIREKTGMSATRENYEILTSHLINSNVLPHENMIREQQRAALAAQVGGQNQPQPPPQNGNPGYNFNQYGNQQIPPQFGPPAPPPSVSGKSGTGGIAESSIEAMSKVADRMSADELGKALQEIQRRGIA